MKNKFLIFTGILAAGYLVACSAVTSNEAQTGPRVFPTATYHFLFQGNTPVAPSDYPVSFSGAPTVASVFQQQPSATPSATAAATSIPILQSTTPQSLQPESFKVTVYDNSLNPNWAVQDNTGMKFDLKSSIHVYNGRSAISFVPRAKNKTEYASLFFAVSDQSTEAYLRDQVTALSFWLYSGDEPLLLDQMAVTILGSNGQPYWKADDHSVLINDTDSFFSETRLYFLGFNRDIPAKTWVQVEVNLDKLPYDPEYKYVTGFYLKTEKGFSRTLWVDDIKLIMLGEPSKVSTSGN